eukprot:2869238-Amphidinium_carterae.1
MPEKSVPKVRGSMLTTKNYHKIAPLGRYIRNTKYYGTVLICSQAISSNVTDCISPPSTLPPNTSAVSEEALGNYLAYAIT